MYGLSPYPSKRMLTSVNVQLDRERFGTQNPVVVQGVFRIRAMLSRFRWWESTGVDREAG